MSTSSKRLKARADAYAHAAEGLQLDWTDDPLEFEEGLRLAEKLEDGYTRLIGLAERQEQREKEREEGSARGPKGVGS
jgi:hypothetical protein